MPDGRTAYRKASRILLDFQDGDPFPVERVDRTDCDIWVRADPIQWQVNDTPTGSTDSEEGPGEAHIARTNYGAVLDLTEEQCQAWCDYQLAPSACEK